MYIYIYIYIYIYTHIYIHIYRLKTLPFISIYIRTLGMCTSISSGYDKRVAAIP